MSEDVETAMFGKKTLAERLGVEPERWESSIVSGGTYDKDRGVYLTKRTLSDGKELYTEYRLLSQKHPNGEPLVQERHFHKVTDQKGNSIEIEMKWNNKKGKWVKSGYLDQVASTSFVKATGYMKEVRSPQGTPTWELTLRRTNKLIPLIPKIA